MAGWITRGGGGGAASDYTGIALLITAIGTLISGVITSVIGLMIAIRKAKRAHR